MSTIRQVLKQQFRNVSKSTSVKAPPTATINPSIIDATNFKVNPLERKLLVWSGKFSNSSQVPNALPSTTMELARNKFRIRVSNMMMGVAALWCLSFVIIKKYKAHNKELEHIMEDEFIRRINGQI